ncbi:MAG: bifunctional hydroxymethylpyrimidine kinase/phosphomethylpyrimidine kinase, partial [Gammaproteobacteria bacterium]|nr:bifunctional hydroxymethylpyrimidine kinase/phosphomethylpyrimidine kinase [Gammaproteobacteria bacterium]
MKGRVLIVAGSDSGGGAGVQADIKTVTALGGYAATAITALTAQDTRDVHEVVAIEPRFIRRQMEVVLEDIGADAIKLGMLHDTSVIAAVCEVIEALASDIPVIVDPVMVAKGGARLLTDDAVTALRHRVLPLATVVTPNVPEAEVIAGLTINDRQSMQQAATKICELGARAVLLTGGHMEGDMVEDLLVTPEGSETFANPRIRTMQTHGTGCT